MTWEKKFHVQVSFKVGVYRNFHRQLSQVDLGTQGFGRFIFPQTLGYLSKGLVCKPDIFAAAF